MAYVSLNYDRNAKAPINKWTCDPNSSLGPYAVKPSGDTTVNPDYCGQCVSFVKQVCPGLPNTTHWNKGAPIRDNQLIKNGTVIATFKGEDYHGHAAIYVSQDDTGITVFDQWCSGNGKSVGQRVLRWHANGVSNNASEFYVVEYK